MQKSSRHLFEVHIAVLLFGLAGLFGKFVHLPSIIIVFGRVFFASIALDLLLLFRRQSIKLYSWRDFAGLCFLGVILAVHWWSFFESIQVSSVAIGLITFSTFPVFVAFMEPLFSGQRPHARDIALALITFAGVALAIPSYKIGSSSTQGLLPGILSGATFALLSILNRKYVQHYGSLVIALYQDIVAAIVLLPFALTFHGTIVLRDVLLLILLGVVFTAAAHALFINGMRSVQAKTASIVASLESVYGIVFAALLLSEIPSLRTIAGGAIVLGAALYASLKSKP